MLQEHCVNTSPHIVSSIDSRGGQVEVGKTASMLSYASGPVAYDRQDYETNGIRFDDVFLRSPAKRNERSEHDGILWGEEALLHRNAVNRTFWQNFSINGPT